MDGHDLRSSCSLFPFDIHGSTYDKFEFNFLFV